MSNDSRRQGVFESPGETGSVFWPPEGPGPLVSARRSRQSIAISVVSAIAALVYVCSPIDLVPEMLVPWVGFVDDVLVLVGTMALVRSVLVAVLSERDRTRKELGEYEETERLYGKWSP